MKKRGVVCFCTQTYVCRINNLLHVARRKHLNSALPPVLSTATYCHAALREPVFGLCDQGRFLGGGLQ